MLIQHEAEKITIDVQGNWSSLYGIGGVEEVHPLSVSCTTVNVYCVENPSSYMMSTPRPRLVATISKLAGWFQLTHKVIT